MRGSDLKLVLASASPRRKDLLNAMGLEFEVDVADIEEQRQSGETPEAYVARLAYEKAAKVRSRYLNEMGEQALVLAADTIVVDFNSQRKVLEKPLDFDDALAMWTSMSGKRHCVMTAICLNAWSGLKSVRAEGESARTIQEFVLNGKSFAAHTQVVSSEVEMDDISFAAMQRYWDSGEPQDKAGGYGLQGLASAWVKSTHGSPSAIVGLPLRETNQMLSMYGCNWL